MKIQIKIILITFILSLNSFAETINKESAWVGTFSKKELTSNLSWWLEAQLRYSLDLGGVGQFLYRTGGLYTLSKTQGVGLLYGYITSSNTNEHRWALQHTQTYMENGNFKLSSRSRFEYRNLEDNNDDSFRLRYLFRLDNESFIVWNEIFLNLTDDIWTGERTVERNRFFIGRSAKVFNSKIEYGYLNQFVPRKTQTISEHVAVLYFFM